jgi:hypothetical protein
LADLGYVVDLAAADQYAAPGRPPPAGLPGVVHPVTLGAGQTRSAIDFGNRAINQAPKVSSITDAADPATVGSIVALAAAATDPDGSVARVGFYRESNGVAGLQAGTGGDTLVGTDFDKAGGFSVVVPTTGLAPGAYTYYALATDNAGAVSTAGSSAPKTTHTLQAPGSISGTIYRDADNDGVRDSAEAGLAGVKVYLDANGNDKLDSNERTITTDSAGRYRLAPLPSGTYAVRVIAPTGHVRTAPWPGKHVVQLGAGQSVYGKDFGVVPSATISGRIFNDLDSDGVRDSTEAGVPNFRVYLDANKNGRLDAGETSLLTGSNGTYSFSGLRPGVHVVRYVGQANWTLSSAYSYYTITVVAAQSRSGVNFGFARLA